MIKSLKLIFAAIIIAGTFVQNTSAQRPYFNSNTDLLLAQFDLKPDEDDVHSAAALGCMLQHADFANINHYVVAGAYGEQGGTFVTEAVPGLYNMLFGQEDVIWTNAHDHWNNSVTWIVAKVKPILNAGGKVFVQEAGQSDITYDWCNQLINEGISESLIKSNVVVVQHSEWNEEQTNDSKLSWIKSNTDYHKIEDGNGTNNTPNFNNKNTSYLESATASSNPNTYARDAWTEAKRVCDEYDASWENPTIAEGGVDFSDCVENWWIFDLSSSITNISTFWDKYVTNGDSTTPPAEQAPYGGTARSIPGTIEAEEFDTGGEGIAYHDSDATNKGGDVMRTSEGVDIETKNGEINIGWTVDGEWIEHTVNIESGTYDIEANIATTTTGKGISLSINGTNLGSISCPNTGGWSNFETVKLADISLNEGSNQILRTTFDGGDLNLNWIKFTKTDTGSETQTVTLSPINDAYLQGSTAYNADIIRIEPNKRTGYLMYDLGSISGTITKAELKLTCSGDSGNGNIDINLGDSNNWSETNLTTSNAPSKGALLGSLNNTYAIGSTYSCSLNTSSLNPNEEVSIVLTQTEGNDVAFASKENSATAPQLVVSYTTLKSASVETGFQSEEKNAFNKPVIFPNPLKGNTLRINTNYNDEDFTIQLVEMTGKTVYQQTTSNSEVSINTNELKPGLYIVKIKHGQDVSTQKLIVK